MIDLNAVYGQAANTLSRAMAELQEGESTIFSADTLVQPPAQLKTRDLVIQRGHNDWCSRYRADVLIFQARKEAIRNLGMLIFGALFHRYTEDTILHLEHPASDIRRLVLAQHHPVLPGYATRPESHTYRATSMNRCPWLFQRVPAWLLPCCYLTVHDERMLATDDDWAKRDTVEGFGPDTGSVLFGDLLLSASQPWSGETEFELEGEGRIGGVGPMSADVRLWLPGHCYFDDTLFG